MSVIWPEGFASPLFVAKLDGELLCLYRIGLEEWEWWTLVKKFGEKFKRVRCQNLLRPTWISTIEAKFRAQLRNIA